MSKRSEFIRDSLLYGLLFFAIAMLFSGCGANSTGPTTPEITIDFVTTPSCQLVGRSETRVVCQKNLYVVAAPRSVVYPYVERLQPGSSFIGLGVPTASLGLQVDSRGFLTVPVSYVQTPTPVFRLHLCPVDLGREPARLISRCVNTGVVY